MIIYKVQNQINGKCYIGKTKDSLESRKQKHLSDARLNRGWYFHNSLKKYGPENFIWKILDTSDSYEDLNQKEIQYIKEYKSFENGYNLTKGGDRVDMGDDNPMKDPVFARQHALKIAQIRKKNGTDLKTEDKNPNRNGQTL